MWHLYSTCPNLYGTCVCVATEFMNPSWDPASTAAHLFAKPSQQICLVDDIAWRNQPGCSERQIYSETTEYIDGYCICHWTSHWLVLKYLVYPEQIHTQRHTHLQHTHTYMQTTVDIHGGSHAAALHNNRWIKNKCVRVQMCVSVSVCAWAGRTIECLLSQSTHTHLKPVIDASMSSDWPQQWLTRCVWTLLFISVSVCVCVHVCVLVLSFFIFYGEC